MEHVSKKRTKNRKRKKKNTRAKERIIKKLEVKEIKHRKIFNNTTCNSSLSQLTTTMPAETFWENYKNAIDWQQRHNVAWWKSRCLALEEENKILRNKIYEQANSESFVVHQQQNPNENKILHNKIYQQAHSESFVVPQQQNPIETNNDTLEFQVDNDMVKFLEQSIRHKMELKKKRDNEDEQDDIPNQFQGPPIKNTDSIKNSTLLYGSACNKIMAMETALQANIDYHKDHEKCCFWPNIPLKS
ncbi:hypothetical protein HCN44_008425 [Aphidius gifuensis]|uniref:Uncharacterized protein n=1 Tax=Aphidius gifuensis TaxID=684658 RepID=A0A834XPG0_APHGI|nr:gem-associated protein 8-like [Aphidius gifuensis]XP_044016817.1 gem-associated protein 8-like [Aphidius gifuensis]XP_044016818.1 gem-associated protein 8-like [Aphidius gifuensis]XP_044016819.1 gem-associated protein 8-like [Aphidius gifuensis]XP_044016821.1 gem-associated protein 8-like [Aphidius gifuensis]XP_044016822.1 gem-associated protein 8-like [Aphidius gifuensis]KAF7989751.1 hypothetical protein HCN44_008425 [Aphidius gifuensis]